MKALLLSIILLFTVNVHAQNVNIPDANFKAFLVGNASINTNGDAEIQVSEAAAYTGHMNAQGLGISSFTGLEAFTALPWLQSYDNPISSLNVTQNTALTKLFCSNNLLTSLDVSQNTALINFRCSTNLLECLNIKNGNNTALMNFYVPFNPYLTCIEVDNVAWSNATWFDIDAQMYFSTNCANTCTSEVGIDELSNTPKQLLKIVDLMGRETPYKPNTVLIYIYSDGAAERVFTLD